MTAIVLGHLNEFEVNRFVYTFHLPVFFIISGYFFDPAIDMITLIRKRFRTIIIPYFTACLLVIISSVAVNILVWHSNTAAILNITVRWIKASLFGVSDNWIYPIDMPGIGALWFLWASFWGILILRILFKIPAIPRILILCALVFFAAFITEYSLFLPLSIQPGCTAAMYIYIGYLWRKHKDEITSLSPGIKVLLAAAALVYWALFIISFKEFWLGCCEYGRGIPEIMGSICASFLVIAFTYFVEKLVHKLTSVIRAAGRYSIIVLTAHIIEQNTFPWSRLISPILRDDPSHIAGLLLTIAFKFIWIFLFTFAVIRIKPARKLFGLRS